jgi:membrane-bound serine protease (ClpP class)
VTDLRPSGKALIERVRVDVITRGEYIEAGCPVVVIRTEGNRVVVKKLEN